MRCYILSGKNLYLDLLEFSRTFFLCCRAYCLLPVQNRISIAALPIGFTIAHIWPNASESVWCFPASHNARPPFCGDNSMQCLFLSTSQNQQNTFNNYPIHSFVFVANLIYSEVLHSISKRGKISAESSFEERRQQNTLLLAAHYCDLAPMCGDFSAVVRLFLFWYFSCDKEGFYD